MEWSIFLISMGMLMSLGLIGIGVCIGDGLAKAQLHKCDNSPDVSGGDTDLSDSGMGETDRAEHSGQDLGSDVPSPELVASVLAVLRMGASQREKEVIDYLLTKEGRN